MAKLKTLSGNPENFKIEVQTQNLNGEDVEITFDCRGRTLRDWHPIFAERIAKDANRVIDSQKERETKTKKKEIERVEFNKDDVAKSIEDGLQSAAEVVLEVACGWDVEDEFNAENIAKMISQFPGIHQKLHSMYDERIRGNRAKN